MLATYIALEWFLSRMIILVFNSMGTNTKLFITNITSVLGRSLVCSDVRLCAVLRVVDVVANVTVVLFIGTVVYGVEGEIYIIIEFFITVFADQGYV